LGQNPRKNSGQIMIKILVKIVDKILVNILDKILVKILVKLSGKIIVKLLVKTNSQTISQTFRRNIFFKNCGQHFVTKTLIGENFNLKFIEILVEKFWSKIGILGDNRRE